MYVRYCLDESASLRTIPDAVRRLAGCSECAAFASYSPQSAPAALTLIREALPAAQHLRSLLTAAGDDLAMGGQQFVSDVTNDLNEIHAALLAASEWLHRCHGGAYLQDVGGQGAADQAVKQSVGAVRYRHPVSVHADEHTAAGVQAIREILAPINEVHVALAFLERILRGKGIADVPF
jgi:hypothetical protein